MATMQALFKYGAPRYLRCYDSGPDTYVDRYTAVYSKVGARQHYPYRSMSAHPTSPGGIGMWGEGPGRYIDTPTYGHLGKKVEVFTLPPDVRRLILSDYLSVWGKDRLHVDLEWLTTVRYRNLATYNFPSRTDGMYHQGDLVYDMRNDNVGIVLMSEEQSVDGGELRIDSYGMIPTEYVRPATLAEVREYYPMCLPHIKAQKP